MAHRRTSRLTFAVLAAIAVVAAGVMTVKAFHSESASTGKLTAQQEGPALPTKSPAISTPISAQMDQGKVEAVLTSSHSPATAPSTRPANAQAMQPTPDAETLFKLATAKRDAGDLVTARNLVNDALAANRLSESDVEAAKSFVGALNDKIIFGTQKFPADAYNKDWKVEPGTALVKLAKRFDVTAELLCRVNGLSSPNKLKAGVTIKTIQGPFYLVVSKSKFEADIYLGNPGGDGSMYVKTVRVGLGADGSTPTGTWLVDTGKVVNPVYYSARGEGVIAADDPKNPLGERWIPLKGIEGDCVGKESYGIHGTIDPSSIGKNMSQGCIRLASDDINLLYDLLIEGKSKVKVVD